MRSQHDKNKEILMDEIEKISCQPMTNAVAEKLNVYRGALDALFMAEKYKDAEEPEEAYAAAITAKTKAKSYPDHTRQMDVAVYSGEKEMTPRTVAEEWTAGMENEDGTHGPHWNIDQVKQVMAQHGMSGSPWTVYAVMNSLYSDYCKVFRKYGVGDKLDFYVDMTKAWLHDEDAVGGGGEEKAKRYFEYVVQH